MKKRTFLKTSSLIVTGTLLSPLMIHARSKPRTNWAGNLTYSTDNLHQPKTVAKAQQTIRDCNKLRALGTRHSFNTIADSTANQVNLNKFDQAMSVNAEEQTVTVDAGVSYGHLCTYLDEQGYALHNLASLPHISIAGACATATHGSGMQNGNLATAVAAMEFINARGELVRLSRREDGDTFRGAVVHLGGIGLVTKLTLDVLPTFQMKQWVYLNLPMEQMQAHFEDIMSAGYSVSLFTDWKGNDINQVWIKQKADDADPDKDFYGAQAATRDVHPIIAISAENCTAQMGVAGPWYERMPHFRMNFTPSSGKELQSEYFVPRKHAIDALMAVNRLGKHIAPHLMISEVRAIDADDLWMSPCYQQPCVTIHFTWKQDWDNVKKVLPMIEQALDAYDVRPHWAKLFTMPPAKLQTRYQQLADFKTLLQQHDSNGKFRNDFLAGSLYG